MSDITMATKVGRGLGWSTVSNLVLRVGNFGVSIIMARLIAPNEFGVFAVALTVWSILGTMAEFGLGADLVRSKDPQRRIPTVATIGLLTSGALALIMVAASAPIATVFESPESTPVIRVMAISLAVFGFTIVPAALLQREFRQGTLFAINGSALVVSTATMTALAWNDFGPMALALGQVAGQIVTVIGMYVATRHHIRLGFDRTLAKESAAFCLPLALANLLSWTLLSVDNLVVARMMSPLELGFYALAFNVSSWPMSAIGQAIRVVALPAFSRLKSREDQGNALTLAAGPIWALALLMGIVLAILAKPVISVLYGERWTPAAVALVGLALFGAVRVIFDLIATFLISLGLSRDVLVVQVWWLIIMIPTMVAGVHWLGLLGAGLSHVAIALSAVLPAYLLCLHRAGVLWRPVVANCLFPTLVAIPAMLATLLLARSGLSPIVTILVAGPTAFILYAAPLSRWWLSRIRLLRNFGTDLSEPNLIEVP